MIPGFEPTYQIFCDVGIWKRYRDLDVGRTLVVCQRRARSQFLRHARCSFKEQVWHFNHVNQVRQMKEENDDLFVSRTVATGGIAMAWKLGARRIFLLGVDGYKLWRRKPETGDFEDVYYLDGTTKKGEKRKHRRVQIDRDTVMIIQDRHDWWIKNMRELRAYFDKRGLFPGPWKGPGVYLINKQSPIDAWQKLKFKTVFGLRSFVE